MFEFHSSFATLLASKAYRAPGTGGLPKTSPLVTTVAHTTPVPAVSPLAESARMPPGWIWLVTVPWAVGVLANRAPLKRYALSVLFAPHSYNSAPRAVERCQYTGPPRSLEVWIFCRAPLSVGVYWPRLAVLSR